MNSGSVTFSFDCEGKWGMADISSNWDANLTQVNLLKTYEFILETLKDYDISATFAFVGAFTESREVFLDETLPCLSSDNYSKWLDYSKFRIIDKNEEGWFMPELLNLVKEYNVHEIASHGYTHIPFSMLNHRDARTELKLIRQWAKKNKIECSTLVYPRNMIGHNNLLKEYGIFGYRDEPDAITDHRVPKVIKTLIEETWVLKKSQQFELIEPCKIPGGVFINWRYGFRIFVPPLVSLLKYRSMINDAILRNQVAHFWTHPHNFITSPSTKNLFKNLCEEVSIQRDKSKLVVKKQNDYLL
jgi:hypothetical protein